MSIPAHPLTHPEPYVSPFTGANYAFAVDSHGQAICLGERVVDVEFDDTHPAGARLVFTGDLHHPATCPCGPCWYGLGASRPDLPHPRNCACALCWSDGVGAATR